MKGWNIEMPSYPRSDLMRCALIATTIYVGGMCSQLEGGHYFAIWAAFKSFRTHIQMELDCLISFSVAYELDINCPTSGKCS